MELWAFAFASAGILAVPGPNVIAVASSSAAHGRLRGLQVVLGTGMGMAIQLGAAALGTSWVAAVLAEHFAWVKWLGIAYLAYMVIRQLRNLSRGVTAPVSSLGSFQRGFWIALSNPKTILLFAAFLPPFTISSEPYMPQIVLLSLIIWTLAILRDIAYVVFADRLSFVFRNRSRGQDRTP